MYMLGGCSFLLYRTVFSLLFRFFNGVGVTSVGPITTANAVQQPRHTSVAVFFFELELPEKRNSCSAIIGRISLISEPDKADEFFEDLADHSVVFGGAFKVRNAPGHRQLLGFDPPNLFV